MRSIRIHPLLYTLLFVVVLSGCVTTATHLYTFRKQVCEFDEYFRVVYDQTVQVEMVRPVLTERDVVMLIGAPPTTRIESEEGLVARYLFEQVPANANNRGSLADKTFEIELMFVASGGDHVLSGIESGEIPPEFHESMQYATTNISAIARQACDIQFNLLSRTTELDIDPDMLELLPERETIISWLGPPHAPVVSGDSLDYGFRLIGEDNEFPVARINAHYEPGGDYPTAINASFTRYQASIDVPERSLRVSLK